MGPEPGAARGPGAQLQWVALSRIRSRSLHANAYAGLIEIMGLFIVKVHTGRSFYVSLNCAHCMLTP